VAPFKGQPRARPRILWLSHKKTDVRNIGFFYLECKAGEAKKSPRKIAIPSCQMQGTSADGRLLNAIGTGGFLSTNGIN
jgi:hypothetical protein